MSTINTIGNLLSGSTGSGNFAGNNSPALISPVLGVATATSINFGESALSTYTQNTWTPGFTFSTAGNLSVAYTTQNGSYTTIGNLVFISFNLVCTPTFTTSTGNLQITGMPISPTKTNQGGIVGAKSNITLSSGYTMFGLTLTSGAASIFPVQFGSGKAGTNITFTLITSGTPFTLSGSFFYF